MYIKVNVSEILRHYVPLNDILILYPMKKKLVVATNNAHKLEEIAAILGDEMELLSLKDIQCFDDIPETADT